MASCKPISLFPSLPAWNHRLPPDTPLHPPTHSSPHPPRAVMSTSPTLLSLSDLQRASRPLSPSKSCSPRTLSTPLALVSMTTLWEEPVATGSLSFFVRYCCPSPTCAPGPLNWGSEGRRAGSGEKWGLFRSSLHSLLFCVLFVFFNFSFLVNSNHFTFCYCCTHNPSSSHPVHHYEMERVFNLSDVTES